MEISIELIAMEDNAIIRLDMDYGNRQAPEIASALFGVDSRYMEGAAFERHGGICYLIDPANRYTSMNRSHRRVQIWMAYRQPVDDFIHNHIQQAESEIIASCSPEMAVRMQHALLDLEQSKVGIRGKLESEAKERLRRLGYESNLKPLSLEQLSGMPKINIRQKSVKSLQEEKAYLLRPLNSHLGDLAILFALGEISRPELRAELEQCQQE